MENKKNLAIEFWRFAFAILICVFHFENYYGTLVPYERHFVTGYIGVEFFFILSGFLIALSNDSKRDGPCPVSQAGGTALAYVKKKFVLVFPRVLVVIVAMVFFTMRLPIINKLHLLTGLEWDLSFLQVTSMGRAATILPPMWYVSALIIAGYFLVFSLAWKKSLTLYLLAPIACIWGYSFFGFHAESLVSNSELMGVLSSGTLRAFAGLSLGILSFCLYKKIRTLHMTRWRLVLANLLELYAIFRIAALVINQQLGPGNYRLLFYFPVIIITSFLNITVVSKILNNRVSGYLGGLSLSIFLIHYAVIQPFLQIMGPPHRLRVSLPLFIILVVALSAVMELAFRFLPKLYARWKEKHTVA